MSILSRNKRPILALLLAFSFLASGAFIISVGLVNTGGLFFYTPIIILAYIPIFWFIESRVTPSALRLWKKREVLALTIWMSFIHFIGIIEALVYNRILFLLFTGTAIFLLLFLYKNFVKNEVNNSKTSTNSKKTVKWFSSIISATLIGLLLYAVKTEMTEKGTLVLLENDQDLVEFLLSILVAVFVFFIFSWLLWQIKSIIKLKSEKKITEVSHLQSQVNPHFFFNTLNNLYGLVDEDPKKAQAMILKLSDMMRYSIYDGQQESVPLLDEVTYLKNYIELHKMRYHKKIDIQFNTNLQEENCKVMPLLFILLLENAFKHGVENLNNDAYIHIDLDNTAKEVSFCISNNYDQAQVSDTPGIGLKNLRRRLKLAYPKKHTLQFKVTDTSYNAQLILDTK